MTQDDTKYYSIFARAIATLASRQSYSLKEFSARMDSLDRRLSLHSRLDQLPHDDGEAIRLRNELAALNMECAKEAADFQRAMLEEIARSESVCDQMTSMLELLRYSPPSPH
jgi:hypothetical protein